MKVIGIVGKTSTGKDSVVSYIQKEYGIQPVVSYTTRPKRINETDGIEHYFIDDSKMDELVRSESELLAYTKFPKTGYRYCSTSKDFNLDSIVTYIIDPPGVDWLKQHRPDVEVLSIHLHLKEEIIKERAAKRGDDIQSIEDRLNSEREIFDTYANIGGYDVSIDTEQPFDCVCMQIKHILSNYGIQPK